MYNFLLCAGMLFYIPPLLIAQHADMLFIGKENTAINDNPAEEDDFFETGERTVPKELMKALPATSSTVTISTIITGRKKGSLIAEEFGKELYSIGFKRNSLHGAWVSRYKDGRMIDSGYFEHNIPSGEWRSWYPDGTLRSIRSYSAGKWFVVQSEISRRNSRMYFHQLTNLLSWSRKSFESYTSGAASFTSLPAIAKSYLPPFKYCLHHGLFMNYYPNGVVKDSGYYKNGLRDGLWNEFYTTGQLSAAGSYLNGFKNSGWKYYSKDGRLMMLAEFKRGKMIHHKFYN